MGVRKFRSIEEMKDAREHASEPRDLPRLLDALWRMGERTRTRRPPPGVYKHGSIEEAKRLKEFWQRT